MSTIRGCWRDSQVSSGVGVLATTNGVFFLMHVSSDRCTNAEPHHADACGEFEPVRPGFQADVDGPDRPIRWIYDWDDVFKRLDRGESMWSILADYAIRPPIDKAAE